MTRLVQNCIILPRQLPVLLRQYTGVIPRSRAAASAYWCHNPDRQQILRRCGFKRNAVKQRRRLVQSATVPAATRKLTGILWASTAQCSLALGPL